jgi:molybdate/tungstate transport system substrate-binding protein
LTGPLVISTTPSMAATMRGLVADFAARHPRVTPTVRSSEGVRAVRAVADSSTVPDVFVSADDTLIDALLMPRYVAWSAGFARSTLVLAYTSRSKYADEISTRNWAEVLSRPETRSARGDPRQDPAAYRTVMLFQLAAHFYLRPDLAAGLQHAVRITDVDSVGRDLPTQLAAGAIDYLPLYRTSAAERALDWIDLPPQLNFGDTAFATSYAAAEVRVPSGVPGAPDTLTIRGAPILYGLTIPRAAPHPALALAFARFLLSPRARLVMQSAGFDIPDQPVIHGDPPGGLLPGP